LEAELKRQRLSARVVVVEAETRICQTLVSRSSTTELVEEAGPLRSAEVREVFHAFVAEVRKARLVVLTGTVPPGCGDDFYARLVSESQCSGVPVLIDAQKVQLVNALRRRPFLVKINRDELAAATRVKGGGRVNTLRALRKLMTGGPQWAVITDGTRSVCVSERPGDRALLLKPPRVKAINPIGSGDAMTAGIAVGVLQGLTMLEAVRLGVACGAANAMTAQPGFARLSDVKRLCSTLNRRIPIV
jgi:tagatose 6-phosphate kinase